MTVGATEGALHGITAIRVDRADCHVAVVPSLGLGDSLIYLIVANNLARAGFKVTLLSNHLAHFA